MNKLSQENLSLLPSIYQSGESSHSISKKFNTSHSSILYHLRKLNIQRRGRSSAAKEGVKFGRIIIKKNKIPTDLVLNADLAYILGVLCGDGYIDYNSGRRTHYVGLSAVDKEFVETFQRALYNFFILRSSNEYRESRRKNWKPQYVTRLSSKEACDFINTIGLFKKDTWRVPDAIKSSNPDIKSSFLKGFFDSEGEIDKNIGRVGATSMNIDGLNEIKGLLRNLGINPTIIKKKDTRPNTHQKFVLRLNDKKSIKLFYQYTGFTINRKQNILEMFIRKWREMDNVS